MPYHDRLQHASLVPPADAIEMLKADHCRVHRLFQAYEVTNESAMQHQSAMALFVALEVHMPVEETVFDPALTEATTRAGHALVATRLEDHEQIEVCSEELQGLEADSEGLRRNSTPCVSWWTSMCSTKSIGCFPRLKWPWQRSWRTSATRCLIQYSNLAYVLEGEP